MTASSAGGGADLGLKLSLSNTTVEEIYIPSTGVPHPANSLHNCDVTMGLSWKLLEIS